MFIVMCICMGMYNLLIRIKHEQNNILLYKLKIKKDRIYLKLRSDTLVYKTIYCIILSMFEYVYCYGITYSLAAGI